MTDLYFNCHQCGKCCNSSPTALFSEIFSHFEKAIFTFRIDTIKTKDGFQSSLRPNVWSNKYNEKGEKYCGFLKDSKCLIQDSKLNMCKLVPLNIPTDIQYYLKNQTLNFYINQGCISKKNKPNFIPIFLNNRINNQSKELSESALLDHVAFQEFERYFTDVLRKQGWKPREGEDNFIIIDFIIWVVERGMIPLEVGLFICQKQSELIVERISYLESLSVPLQEAHSGLDWEIKFLSRALEGYSKLISANT